MISWLNKIPRPGAVQDFFAFHSTTSKAGGSLKQSVKRAGSGCQWEGGICWKGGAVRLPGAPYHQQTPVSSHQADAPLMKGALDPS